MRFLMKYLLHHLTLFLVLVSTQTWSYQLKSITVADNAYGFTVSQDEKRAYVSTQNCTEGERSEIDVIDLEAANLISKIVLPGCMNANLYLNSNEKKLYAASGSIIYIIDTEKLKIANKIALKKDNYIVSGSANSYNKEKIFYIVSSTWEKPFKYILVFNTKDDKVESTIAIPFAYSTHISGIAVSKDVNTLFISPQPLYLEKQKIFALDVITGKINLIKEFDVFTSFDGLMTSPDGNYLYLSGAEPKLTPGDDEITDWDILQINLATLSTQKIYNAEHDIVATAISNDSKKLYIIDHRRGHEGIVIFDATTGNVLNRFSVPDEKNGMRILSSDVSKNHVYFTTKHSPPYPSLFNVIYDNQ